MDFEEALAADMIELGICGAPGRKTEIVIRTIKIDGDAFERLDHARRADETLSEVIKRCVPERRSPEEISRILSKIPFSEKYLEAVDRSATRRRRVGRKRRT